MTSGVSEPRTGERGMTLVELLTVIVVLGLLIVITDRVFIGVHQASRTTQRAADMQQNARIAAVRLRREVREARLAAMICYPDPSCRGPSTQVAFPSARPSETASVFCLDVAIDDAGRRALESACTVPVPFAGTYLPVWQRYIGYHLDAGGELRRIAQSVPISLPMPARSGQVVASYVTAFTISQTGRQVRVQLRSRSPAAGGGGGSSQEMMLDDTIELRNAIPAAIG